MADHTRALGGAGTPVTFPNGTVVSGMAGEGLLRQRVRQSGAFRSARIPGEIDTDPAFDRALRALGIREQETLEAEARNVDTAQSHVTIDLAADEEPARPRVVLYQDESGGLSWHFPVRQLPGRPGLRAGPTAGSFVIPLRTSAAQATIHAGTPRRTLRGPIAIVGRKIFKALVLPAASAVLGEPAQWFGQVVERRFKQYKLWQVTADNYAVGPDHSEIDWRALHDGPVLLLVHGIFSSVEGMLARLPRAAMLRWQQRYQGRIIGFNHLTVSESPEDNVRRLMEIVRDGNTSGKPLSVDIICHSRGGIVSRTLCERGAELADGVPPLAVRSIYFVAAPNAGSLLGDADHMIDFIDRVTNCVGSLPDGPAAYSIELVLGLVMLAGHAGVTALPGIRALGTRGSYVSEVLNRGVGRVSARYAAAAADFKPRLGRDNGWFIDRLADPVMDGVFTVDGVRTANDIIVPQDGVYAHNGHPAFPIEDRIVFKAEDGLWHTALFGEPRAVAHIDAHLDQAHGSATRASFDISIQTGAIASHPGPASAEKPVPAPPIERPKLRALRGDRAVFRGRSEGGGNGAAPVPHVDSVERLPQVLFPERVEEGASATLRVELTLPVQQEILGRILLHFDAGSDEIELDAELSAPGFRIDGARHAKLRVRRVREPNLEVVEFHLTAATSPADKVKRELVVTFWRGNECVGSASKVTWVCRSGSTLPTGLQAADVRPSSLRVPLTRREAPDLVLTIRRLDTITERYEIEVRCQIEGEEYESRSFGNFDLDGQELAAYLSEVLTPSFEKFPGAEVPDDRFDDAVAAWNRDFVTLLGDFGAQLWLHLPPAFRDEYLRLVTLDRPPRSMCIYSTEFSFPWEIVRPSGMVAGDFHSLPPLGVAHVLARWKPGTGARPQPQTMRVSNAVLVVPDAEEAGLPWAQEEVVALQALLKGARTLRPVSRRKLDQLLADKDVQIVHFSGHGVTGANADLSALELEAGEKITAMAFAATALGRVSQPMLYLNACSVGRGGRVLKRAGGFASNCIEGGWSGVVASYWPVYDPSASAFSQDFYGKLVAGRSVGEALRELRSERPDDPTSQSYTYFGDPYARLAFL